MTRNSPITYQDFISIVENSDLDADDYENANVDFKFTDIEVGKIYVFYSGTQVWFITPCWIAGEYDYGMIWCYLDSLQARVARVRFILEGSGNDCIKQTCGSWQNHVWSGRRWHVLDTIPHFKYINWTDDPFEVKS